MNRSIDKQCAIYNSHDFSLLLEETKFKKMDLAPNQFITQCINCKIVSRFPSLFSKEFDKDVQINVRKHKEFIGGGTKEVASYLKDRLLYASKIVKNKTLLDVGCGSDALLVYAKEQGWIVYGTEYEIDTVERLKGEGIHCFFGDLNNAELQEMKFNFIHLNHVFEHVKNPLEILSNCNNLLKKDGMIIIEVPNEFLGFMQIIRRILKLDGSSHTSYFQHEWFYAAKTLNMICEKSGFRVLTMKTPFRKSNNLLKDIILFIASKAGYGEVIEVHLTKK